MTLAQEDRRLGFLESLARRKVDLTFPDGQIVPALVQPIEPQSGEFVIGTNEREYSNVRPLREDLDGVAYQIGSYLVDEVNHFRHRIADIKDHPTDITIGLICETVPITT
jgi:hypothetical protein